MKKTISILLIILTCVSLMSACGKKADGNSTVGDEIDTILSEAKAKAESIISEMESIEHEASEEIRTAAANVKAELEKIEQEIKKDANVVTDDIKTAINEVKAKIDQVESEIKNGKLKDMEEAAVQDLKQSLESLKTKISNIFSSAN